MARMKSISDERLSETSIQYAPAPGDKIKVLRGKYEDLVGIIRHEGCTKVAKGKWKTNIHHKGGNIEKVEIKDTRMEFVGKGLLCTACQVDGKATGKEKN